MPHTLLLVDDSVAIQRVVELTFAAEDIRIVAVGTGQQAIDRLSDDPPDIVLADIGMPIVDGYAVASFVRRHEALRGVPVLLMVGAFDPVDEDRVRASGASGVLVKPFEPALVISRVKELLGLRPQMSQRPQAPQMAQTPPNPGDTSGDAADRVSAPAATVADVEHDSLPQDSSERLRARLAEARPESSEVRPSPVEAPWATVPAPTPPAPAPPAPPGDASVADAFSALLAAEQGEAIAPAAAPTAEPALSLDAIVEQVTARVVEQIGTAAARERAERIVVEVAERLVREEIARIRESAAARR